MPHPEGIPFLYIFTNSFQFSVKSLLSLKRESVFYQLRHPDPDYPNQELYMGALIFSLILLALSSIWMATNHRYETDKNQRRKNVNIELGYCCIQLLVGLLTIQFGLGLVGAAMIIAVTSVYILYINPKFMSRKLTK